jgi:hemolysin activation/secretion protein
MLARAFLLIGLSLLAAAAMAQSRNAPPAPVPTAAQEPKFEIRKFLVEGATLLTGAEIETATAPFVGPDKDFADVQRALEALERAYSSKGYSAVQVILPEQELEKGEIRLKVIEARIGKLVVEGNKFFDETNIRDSLPSLATGKAPNIHEIAESLRLANESPAKQTTVLLRGGAEEGDVDAVARVSDENPAKYSFTVDNTGTPQTGILRTGYGFQHANLWGLDHVLSMQYVTAPYNDDNSRLAIIPSSNVFIVGAAYHVPLYSLGDSLDFSAGYSNVNSGQVQFIGGASASSFNVSGSGSIAGLRYNFYLNKLGDIDQKLALGLDWRAYQSFVAQPGSTVSLVPDVTVHPVSLNYSGIYRQPTNETSFYLSYAQNLPGGNDGGSTAFDAARPGARPGYTVWRYGLNHNRGFESDWQARFAFSGQLTRDELVPGEQYGIGGVDSVRGFLEREVTNDYGYRGTLEFYTPDFSGKMPILSGMRARALVFTDWGGVQRNNPTPSEIHGQHIGSVGFGLRISRGTNMSFRVDYAVVTDAGGNEQRGDGRVHASFSYVF